jgi:hypothetical protein
MPGINPQIVFHEIKTYLRALPIRQRICPVHPRKVLIIKTEVQFFLNAGLIYPMHLIE